MKLYLHVHPFSRCVIVVRMRCHTSFQALVVKHCAYVYRRHFDFIEDGLITRRL